jgi:hypothetical protein
MVNRGGGRSRARAIDILPYIERLGYLDARLVRAGDPMLATARPARVMLPAVRLSVVPRYVMIFASRFDSRARAGLQREIHKLLIASTLKVPPLIGADDRGRCHGAGADRLLRVELRVLRRLRGAELAAVPDGVVTKGRLFPPHLSWARAKEFFRLNLRASG